MCIITKLIELVGKYKLASVTCNFDACVTMNEINFKLHGVRLTRTNIYRKLSIEVVRKERNKSK